MPSALGKRRRHTLDVGQKSQAGPSGDMKSVMKRKNLCTTVNAENAILKFQNDRVEADYDGLTAERWSPEIEQQSHEVNSVRENELVKQAATTNSEDPLPPIREIEGDLFEIAPEHSVLIHAVNCQGKWGAGIALDFCHRFPHAFTKYQEYCKDHAENPKALLGKALLIPPSSPSNRTDLNPQRGYEKRHFVACLFTSVGFGRHKDTKADILHNTASAMRSLLREWAELRVSGNGVDIGELWACKINSGKFGVPWERTRAVLEREVRDGRGEMDVQLTVVNGGR